MRACAVLDVNMRRAPVDTTGVRLAPRPLAWTRQITRVLDKCLRGSGFAPKHKFTCCNPFIYQLQLCENLVLSENYLTRCTLHAIKVFLNLTIRRDLKKNEIFKSIIGKRKNFALAVDEIYLVMRVREAYIFIVYSKFSEIRWNLCFLLLPSTLAIHPELYDNAACVQFNFRRCLLAAIKVSTVTIKKKQRCFNEMKTKARPTFFDP